MEPAGARRCSVLESQRICQRGCRAHVAYDLSLGAYVVNRLAEALWLDAFAALGVGRNRILLDNGTLALDGDYQTRTLMLGASLTGSVEFDHVELRPQISLSHATTWIGDVGFDASAVGETDQVSLEAGRVSLTRLRASPEIRMPFALGEGSAELIFTPRAVCEWSHGAERRSDCGGGAELGLAATSRNGLSTVGGRMLFEEVGRIRRTSFSLELVHRF